MHRAACTTQHAEPATGNRHACNTQIDHMEQEAYDMHADMCDTETIAAGGIAAGEPRTASKRITDSMRQLL